MKRTKLRLEKPEVKYTLKELEKIMPEKHKAFVKEWIVNGWNGTRAYMKVYTDAIETTAASNSCALLRSTKIIQYKEYMKESFEELCGVSKAKQLAEYVKIGYSSLRHLHNSWISLKEYETICEENPEALDALEVVESKTEHYVNGDKELKEVQYVKLKLFSKLQALQRIDKLLGYEAAEKLAVSGQMKTTFDITKYTDEEKQVLLKIARQNEYKD